jgi:hypothetical protein
MLQDVVENSGLEGYAEIGLLLFVAAFIFVIVRVWLMNEEEAESHANIPLDDESDRSTEESHHE